MEKVQSSELKRETAVQFRDPTIWAYATLLDNQHHRLTLYPFQDKIINDTHRFIHVTGANQIGKSLTICVKALHHALFVPNASVMIVSASEQQAVMILDEMKWLLRRATIPYNKLIGEVENRTELHLQGPQNSVSVIRCFPPTKSALGFHATLLILDEVAFWEKISELTPTEYYDQVLEPRTNMTKSWTHPFLTMGQIFFITNPNGQNGIAWRSFAQDERFHCYRFCWLAYPKNTLEDYNEAKKRLPSYRFASIFAAEYVNADGGFITMQQYNHFISFDVPLIIPENSQLYLGGDFAGEDIKSKSGDNNVLIGVVQVAEGNKMKLRLVYYKEWKSGTKKSIIYEEIARLKTKFTIVKFCYDKVGVGDKIKNDLIDQGILNAYQVESLTYSLENKSEVYLNFQAIMEMGSLEGCDIPSIRNQIFGLVVEQKHGSTHLKIHHATESTHDDACFVAGTLVLTDKGQIPIEKLRVGDKVMTRKGFRRIIATGNRMKEVITRLGLTGTPDHPIITKNGTKMLINVNVSDTIYKWNEKQSCIMESVITDTLLRQGGSCECITGHIQKKCPSHYIGKSGKTTTELFQRDSSSTIRMATPLITALTILSVFLIPTMRGTTKPQRGESGQERTYDLLKMQPSVGTSQKREENGIKAMGKNVGQMKKEKRGGLQSYAYSVKKKSLLTTKGNYTVPLTAMPKFSGEKRRVYNLTVLGANEYFANNVLVHNCDALANACYAAKRLSNFPVSFEFVPHKPLVKVQEEVYCKHYLLKHTEMGELECRNCGESI